ncbi:curli-like amyloid fiber formation chaperone CsgH [Pseudogemmobacter bohemicus]|uniref:curli-like amyloid fiber formation chaperone CsgH n=1 Tax=Pseudogemmobacter bohemicus TaxID=2250708 RepID=UPI000DD4B1B9|nr:curli-like amyloid fiber formation chaperone CsgH [Pseudogemmobacter bohemicus]
MTDTANGLVAIILSLFFSSPDAGPETTRPMPSPVLAGHTVKVPANVPACAMAVIKGKGGMTFTASITASDAAISGRYKLKLDGKGRNTVSIEDERSLSLAPGEKAVLSELSLEPGTRLSGQIILEDSKGKVVCQDSL